MDVKKIIKKPVDKLAEFGSGAAGLSVGAAAMKAVNSALPDATPDWLKKIGPGLAGMGLAYAVMLKSKDNQYVNAGALGLGLAGFADALKGLLGDKFTLLTDHIPSLRGVPGYAAVNTGDYPPNYYKENAFQGLGGVPMNGDAFSLSGVPMNGSAYALSGSAYALS